MPARLLFLRVSVNGTRSDMVRIRPTSFVIAGFPAREDAILTLQ